MTTAPKKRKLKGGTGDAPPTVGQWVDEAKKIAAPEANGEPAKPSENIPNPIPDAAKPDEKPLAGAIDAVVNRVKEVNGPHVSEGDWRAQRDADIDEIMERRDSCIGRMDELKEKFAAEKSTKKALDVELVNAVRDRKRKYPPRPAKLYPDPKPEAKAKGKSEPSKNGMPEDDSWKTVPLASLQLPKGILEKLANPVHKHRGAVPPIKTIGDLTEFLKEKDGWEPRLTDLKGLGKTAVDKITAATDQFWTERAKAKPVDKPSMSTEKQKADEKSTKESDVAASAKT